MKRNYGRMAIVGLEIDEIITTHEAVSSDQKILGHLGLPSSAPKLAPARGPPKSDQDDLPTQEFFEN